MKIKVKDMSDNSHNWWMFMMNDRDCHGIVSRMLDDGAGYVEVMTRMQDLYRRFKHQVGGSQFHRIMTYVHMAQSMDRVGDVSESVIRSCVSRGDVEIERTDYDEHSDVRHIPEVKQTKQEITMEFTTVHYLNGNAIDTLEDEQLIKHIRDEKKSKESLIALNVDSDAIRGKIKQHTANIDKLIRILDNRVKTAE